MCGKFSSDDKNEKDGIVLLGVHILITKELLDIVCI